MVIELYTEPRKVYSWSDFIAQKGAYSIALDGLVDASTKRDEQIPCANFDHHRDSDRASTLSTCMQVYEEINTGLFNTFQHNGVPTANVYVNDPDEDTCLAWWLLSHFELVRRHANPRINRLVTVEDKLDRHAGLYPLGNTSFRRQMAWIFEPYTAARYQGTLYSLSSQGMKTIIEAVNSRISEHVFGKGSELTLEGSCDIIGGGSGWSLIRETGPAARMALTDAGIQAFVSVKEAGDSYRYTLGRVSPWIPFPLPQLYTVLNNLERGLVTPGNQWGGSDTIGGSPRETGSRIPPAEIENVINNFIGNC